MKPPRLSGPALVAARVAAESPGSDVALRKLLRSSMGIDGLGMLPASFRAPLAMEMRPLQARAPRARAASGLPLLTPGDWPRSAASFTQAYRDGKLTPRAVAERVIAALDSLPLRRPTMNVLAAKDPKATLRDADAASARWASGAPRGPLDGVPFLVKDEFDVEGLPTRLGSRIEPETPAAKDSAVVARLRRAGAVFAGKTVLTEWGMSPIGANTHFEMPHNAHDPTRAPGGSSTGSGVGVALGLAPIAAGGDGGGSIRIPASLNGVFGIKPTFGRVSRAGDIFAGSVAHAGPLAASTLDLVAFLDAVASEPDPDDAITQWAPPPPDGGFGALVGAGVRGLKIGVDDTEWRDASPEVARACEDALKALEKEGAEIVRIDMPIAHHASPIGYLTIAPESVAANREHWLHRRAEIGDDVRLTYAFVAGLPTVDQIDAQRLRAGMRREVAEILRRVDVIAMPTTAITAPRYTEEDARGTFADPEAINGLCRFNFLGNLTGLPAATAPVGADAAGLPIGLQILGDAWDEATVLAVLAHLERIGASKVRRPKSAIDVLG
jgi:aspartyl-tRNA(Asn)/glutamyl-tRNA(Gln) amidotransferase subunit A